MLHEYTRRELESFQTIEQAWDGDELKIHEGDIKIWLTHKENRQYNGDYTVERLVDGKWEQANYYFN